MPLRVFARQAVHLLLATSLIVSGGLWPVGNVAEAASAGPATGMPCHEGAVATPSAHPCNNGCCPQSSCDPSACIASACPPQVLILPGVLPPARLQVGWHVHGLPSRLIDTPLRPPIA
jgi:hypothetical protein